MTTTWEELQGTVSSLVDAQKNVIGNLANTSSTPDVLAEEQRYLEALSDLSVALQIPPADMSGINDALPSHLLKILKDLNHQKEMLGQPTNPWAQQPIPIEQLTAGLKLMTNVISPSSPDPDKQTLDSLNYLVEKMPTSQLKRNLLILGVALGIVSIIAASVFCPPLIIPLLAASAHFFSLTAFTIPGVPVSVAAIVVSVATGISQSYAMKTVWNYYQQREYDTTYNALKRKIITMGASVPKDPESKTAYLALLNEAKTLLTVVEKAKDARIVEKINGKPVTLGTLINTLKMINEVLESGSNDAVQKLHNFEEEVHKSSFLKNWEKAGYAAKFIALAGAISLVTATVISPSTWFTVASYCLPAIGTLPNLLVGMKIGDAAVGTLEYATNAKEKIMSPKEKIMSPRDTAKTGLVSTVSSFKDKYQDLLNTLPSRQQPQPTAAEKTPETYHPNALK